MNLKYISLLLIVCLFSFACATKRVKVGVLISSRQVEEMNKGVIVLPNIKKSVEKFGGEVLYLYDGHEHPGEYKGLLVPGGIDVDPSMYNEKSIAELETFDHSFDVFEFRMIENAKKEKMPILGICRGLQVLNVQFGGSLYQDIPTQIESDRKVTHRKRENNQSVFTQHEMTIKKESQLSKYFPHETVTVNSYHHQGIKKLGTDLEATAYAPDGIIEAIEWKKSPSYFLGVQFHPEKNESNRDEYDRIISDFIEHVRGNH